jgi:apolipoprotein N-acyltransferase
VRRKFLAFLLGAAAVLSFAPFGFYPLAVLALAGMFLLWDRCTGSRQVGALGFAFGLGFFLAGVSWVYVSLHDFGGMAAPLAAGFTLLFCAFLACFPALVGLLSRKIPATTALRSMVLAPALWALLEWVRGWIFTGFPWLAIGYSQVPESPLAGYAPVLGVYGISLMTAMTAGALAFLVQNNLLSRSKPGAEKWSLASSFALSVLISIPIVGAGLKTIHWTKPLPGEPTTVALLQGNITQDLKWRPEQAIATLETYAGLVRASDATLIVLPETAIPMFQVHAPPAFLEMLVEHGKRNGGDILVGVPELDTDGRYYNSVMSFGSSTNRPYRKQHLVPFGDYFPLRPVLGWIMQLMEIPMSAFSPGEGQQRPLQVAGQKVAINICYEDAFGEEIIRQLPEATLLANFTNDAWWGKSIASRQHLQMAQMRALETGRPMLRATNTGVTAIIDVSGRIAAQIPEFATTTLTGTVQGYQGATPYVRAGNYAFLALVFLMLAAPIAWSRRKQR